VKNLHYDDRKPVLAKNLVHGKSCLSKLFFVFNINEVLLEENQKYHSYHQHQMCDSALNGENIINLCMKSHAFHMNHGGDSQSFENSMDHSQNDLLPQP
jgi:hypothetical protein